MDLLSRWSGPFDSPNIPGILIAAALVVVCALCLRVREAKHRLLKLSFFVVLAAGGAWMLAQTGSRGGMVALIGGLAVLTWLTTWNWRMMAGLSTVIIGVILVHPLTFGRAVTVMDASGDSSSGIRLDLWVACLDMAADHLWSFRTLSDFPGSAGAWFLRTPDRTFANPVSTPLTLLWCTGVWGALVFAVMGAAVVGAWRSIRKARGVVSGVAVTLLLGSLFSDFSSDVWIMSALSITILLGLWLAWDHRPFGILNRGILFGVGGYASLILVALVLNRTLVTNQGGTHLCTRPGSTLGPVLLVTTSAADRWWRDASALDPYRGERSVGVLSMESPFQGAVLIASAAEQLRIDDPLAEITVIASEEAAQATLIAAPLLGRSRIVAIDPVLDSPIEKLSPLQSALGPFCKVDVVSVPDMRVRNSDLDRYLTKFPQSVTWRPTPIDRRSVAVEALVQGAPYEVR